MNDFESGARKVIPAVLVYARQGDRVLMIHRNGRPDDFHSGKWNGLGGKCESDESPLEAARREFHEESGLRLPEEAFRCLGVLQFPNFKPAKSEDWVVFVFTARLEESFEPAAAKKGGEGSVHWVRIDDLARLPLWAGDRHFIPNVVAETPFVGTIWYRGEEVSRHWIQTLSG